MDKYWDQKDLFINIRIYGITQVCHFDIIKNTRENTQNEAPIGIDGLNCTYLNDCINTRKKGKG